MKNKQRTEGFGDRVMSQLWDIAYATSTEIRFAAGAVACLKINLALRGTRTYSPRERLRRRPISARVAPSHLSTLSSGVGPKERTKFG